jgi:hypothetical protein
MKYLGINIIKKVKDLNTENYKTLLKEIEEDRNKWKHSPCSCIRINIVKMPILSKAIYRFNTILIKIPVLFFTTIDNTIIKLIRNYKKILNSQDTLEQKEQSWKHHTT